MLRRPLQLPQRQFHSQFARTRERLNGSRQGGWLWVAVMPVVIANEFRSHTTYSTPTQSDHPYSYLNLWVRVAAYVSPPHSSVGI